MAPRTSPLHAVHEELGARMIDFGDWLLPVQYQGILEEHRAVRSRAGLFDISHMGQLAVSGQQSADWLNSLLTNDVQRLTPLQGHYTLLLNEAGGVVDDLLCYRTGEDSFLLVVNAARTEEVFHTLLSRAHTGIQVEDQSALWAGMALQGPRSAPILQTVLQGAEPLPKRNHIALLPLPNGPVFVARTGYTGEDGFEWFCPAQFAAFWWQRLMEAGKPEGLLPCGLGARDTLRLEAGLPLNGNDLSAERTALEAVLERFVKFDKGDFQGRSALERQRTAGVPSKLSALLLEGKTPPPRPHYPLLHEGVPVGETTSGTLSPTLNQGIALGYLPTALAQPGTRLEIKIRERNFPAVVVEKPFYKRP